MLDMQLERTILKGRRAFTITSLKVDGKFVDETVVMSPDGDLRLTTGDTYYAKDFARVYQDLVASSRNWSGKDAITMDNLPY